MEGQHDAPSSDLNPLRDRRNGCRADRRVGVQTAEAVEVALRRPHGGEAVTIREPRPVQQQAVLIRTLFTPAAGEVEQAEIQRPALSRTLVCRSAWGRRIAVDERRGRHAATPGGGDTFNAFTCEPCKYLAGCAASRATTGLSSH